MMGSVQGIGLDAAASDPAPTEEEATFARLRDKLNAEEISDVQAARAFLVRQYNVLIYERAQMEKQRQEHVVYINNIRRDIEALKRTLSTLPGS